MSPLFSVSVFLKQAQFVDERCQNTFMLDRMEGGNRRTGGGTRNVLPQMDTDRERRFTGRKKEFLPRIAGITRMGRDRTQREEIGSQKSEREGFNLEICQLRDRAAKLLWRWPLVGTSIMRTDPVVTDEGVPVLPCGFFVVGGGFILGEPRPTGSESEGYDLGWVLQILHPYGIGDGCRS
jgi:hypothetical protein